MGMTMTIPLLETSDLRFIYTITTWLLLPPDALQRQEILPPSGQDLLYSRSHLPIQTILLHRSGICGKPGCTVSGDIPQEQACWAQLCPSLERRAQELAQNSEARHTCDVLRIPG